MQQYTRVLCKDETAHGQANNEHPCQDTMKRPMHRRWCQSGPWWVAGKGIHGKHPRANQAKTADALEQRKPDRTAPWRQEPIPAKSREYHKDAEDDEIDLLHPATRT